MPQEEPLLPLHNTTSHRSSIYTMQELDPSPVEETPPSIPTNPDESNPEKDPSSYFPPSRSTTNSLGIRNNRIPQILLALQKYSTIPPTLYLIMHYTNTAIIPLTTLSLDTAERSILLTRPYYQSFPIEPLLIFLPLATHALSGLSLRLYRRRQAAMRYGAETHAQRRSITRDLWPTLSLTSALGYALYPMMIGHVVVNRFTPKNVHGDSSAVGLRFFSYGVARHPWVAGAGYAVMIAVASFHFVGGAAKYLRLTREYVSEGGDYGAVKRRNRGWAVNALSAVVAGVWMLGGLGVIGRGVGGSAPSAWETKAWDEVYRSVPIVGAWM